MGRNDGLREALNADLCIAPMHNTVQTVLLLDLLREIGALVLDPNKKSASVASAMVALRDKAFVGRA